VLERVASARVAKTGRRVIAVFSISGGITGLIAAASALGASMPGGLTLVSVGFIAAYLLGIVAGVSLLENPAATRLATWFVWLQVPILQSKVLSFQLSSLASFDLLWSHSESASISWNWGSRWTLGLFQPSDPFLVGCNLLALAFLVVLRCARAS
jgi:hypothetical protein